MPLARRQREPRLRPRSLVARRGGAGLRDRLPGRHCRQRGAAEDRPRPARIDQHAAVDSQRLFADARLADPSRRVAWRPLWAASRLRCWHRPIHDRLAALCGCAECGTAGRGEARPGDRRGASDTGQSGDGRVRLSPRRQSAGNRRVVGSQRGGGRSRPACRRPAGGGSVMAGGVFDQRSARHLHCRDGRPPPARDP